jgi:hypothetical protein
VVHSHGTGNWMHGHRNTYEVGSLLNATLRIFCRVAERFRASFQEGGGYLHQPGVDFRFTIDILIRIQKWRIPMPCVVYATPAAAMNRFEELGVAVEALQRGYRGRSRGQDYNDAQRRPAVSRHIRLGDDPPHFA